MSEFSDAQLEREILKAYDAFMAAAADRRDDAEALWHRYRKLHAARSPEKVAQLERARGLQ